MISVDVVEGIGSCVLKIDIQFGPIQINTGHLIAGIRFECDGIAGAAQHFGTSGTHGPSDLLIRTGGDVIRSVHI